MKQRKITIYRVYKEGYSGDEIFINFKNALACYKDRIRHSTEKELEGLTMSKETWAYTNETEKIRWWETEDLISYKELYKNGKRTY